MGDRLDRLYSSQPVPKAVSWTEEQWRRLRRPNDGTGESSTSFGSRNQAYGTEGKRFPGASVEESRHWSKSVTEFYNNGDAPFCYTKFVSNQLDNKFWGTLLGHQSGGLLSSTHVEAWTERLMRVRQGMLLKDPSKQQRWMVLPPHFIDSLRGCPSGWSPFCDLFKQKPYPPLRAVDHLYLPLMFNKNDWLLVRIDMQTMTITKFITDKRWKSPVYRNVLHNWMAMLSHCFNIFLEYLQYWRRFDQQTKRELSVGRDEDNVPQDKGSIANSGVLVCMMMDYLVKDKPLVLECHVDEACAKYRQKMADELYKWRCVHNSVEKP